MLSNTTGPLKRRTLRDEVLDYLLELIVKGEYQPGDRIVESRIARELQISQGAVREAFRDFVAMGFLETKPYTATRFSLLTEEDLADYYSLRAELEILAIKWAFERKKNSAFDFDFMKHCVEKLFILSSVEQTLARSRTGLAFHHSIVRASGSRSLEKAWNSLGQFYWSLMGIRMRLSASTEEMDRKNAEEHLQIYQALKEGNKKGACKLMRLHFQNAIGLLKDIIP